ncbi:mutator family transposase [Murinocardiopsis flavida]|uniref:Mutator family transposase n=1 Tax=Murinocardiopsis flavida TaxID=645275 RepID=A0A2P8DS10_9ACTN|nr:mutator family transposase [Murinocardiopsis flavida]
MIWSRYFGGYAGRVLGTSISLFSVKVSESGHLSTELKQHQITDDLDVLLEFYDYPAEHWVHLRTTNPIESTFATVRLRRRVTK